MKNKLSSGFSILGFVGESRPRGQSGCMSQALSDRQRVMGKPSRLSLQECQDHPSS
jgi:hypothetical protein